MVASVKLVVLIKKIVAANKAGATIFFAPYVKPTKALLALEEEHQTNYQLAKETAKKSCT